MAIEIVEALLFAALFAVDAYGYAKLRESQRDVERVERNQGAHLNEKITETRGYAKENNQILKSGGFAATSVSRNVDYSVSKTTETDEDGERMAEKMASYNSQSSQRFSDLEEGIEKARSDYHSQSSKVDDIEQRLGEVENDVADLERKASEGSVPGGEIERRFTEIDEKLVAMTTHEADDKTLEKIKEAYQRIKKLQDRIATAEQDVASLNGELSVQRNELLQRIEDSEIKVTKLIESRVANVEKKLDKKISRESRAVGKSVTAISKTVASTKSALQRTQAKVSGRKVVRKTTTSKTSTRAKPKAAKASKPKAAKAPKPASKPKKVVELVTKETITTKETVSKAPEKK